MSEATNLSYQVVFWDSEAPGFEGSRVQFSENSIFPIDITKGLETAWRSDRRCQFPVEIGLYLQAPCRLQEIVVFSEPALAPSAVELFVAGPTRSKIEGEGRGGDKRSLGTFPRGIDQRHSGPTTASTDAARAGYLSSVFVRAGRVEFSRAKAAINTANGVDLSETKASQRRQNSTTGPTDATTAMRGAAVAPSVAVLSGLTFKGQFLRLMLSEAAGSSHNPGRQVSVTRIKVSGCLLTDEHPPGEPKPAAQNRRGAAPGARATSGEDGDRDRELQQVLVDLGIDPLLGQGALGKQQAPAQGEWGRRGVSREGSGSVSVHASDGKGCEGGGLGGGGGTVQEQDDVAVETTRKVKQMLHIARSEERFHDAEMLSLQLDRVRSLVSRLCTARRAQERAARRENFDQAKKFRDDAREAEVWLLQTVRDASDILDAGGGGVPSRHQAQHPLAADPSTVAGKDAPSGAASPTPATELQELAPSHDPGRNYSRESSGDGTQNHLASDVARRRSTSGDGSERSVDNEERPPWLMPSCPKSTKPWRALLKLPWPAGVQPDFRTVFSHKWVTSTVDAYRNHPAGTELGGGSGGGGGGPTSRIPLQPGGLLRTILRLVAASQDLRPPGPVPPDVAPFRQAGNAYGRPPLCTFFLPPARLAGGEDRNGETAVARENTAPGNKSNNALHGQNKDFASKTRVAAGGREDRVVVNASSQQSIDAKNRRKAGDAADRRVGDLGRAFGHPAADSTPAATHVVNFIEDNPDLAWSSFALCGPHTHGQRDVQHLTYTGTEDDFANDNATNASKPEAGRRKNKGKRRRSSADVDDDEKSGKGAPVRSRRRSGEDRVGDTETAVASVTAVGVGVAAGAAPAGERLLEEARAPLKSPSAMLPDVIGAGGFAELVPLLDLIFGRVPVSAACAGFPARMRESSIRLCQAHLDLTADAAVEAYIAATDGILPSTTATSTQPTSSSSSLNPPASLNVPQRGSEAGSKCGSQADLSGKLKVERLENPKTNGSFNSGESESSGSNSRSAIGAVVIGAVVKAACLVAAQGLMDPTKEVRLAGEDLMRSGLSLWSSAPAAAGEGAGDQEEIETGAIHATAVLRSNAAAKNGSTSDEDLGNAGDGRAIGNAAGSRGSVGSDDGVRDDPTRKSEADNGNEDTEHPPTKTAPNDAARTDSNRESEGRSARSSVNDSDAKTAIPKVRASVPLRDLRWGLELVLACVAPYLVNGAVVSDENGDRVIPATGGSAAGPVGNNSGRRSTCALIDSRTQIRTSPDERIAGDPLHGGVAGEGSGSGSGGGCNRDGTEETGPSARPANSPVPEEGGGNGHDDGDRSLLALRVVDFACRHPDIGPALVSSVLVGWIPCLMQWGRNTTPSASPGLSQTKVGRASMPQSPRRAAFTAGEAAASEALASGAIEMIIYMVQNFPLLPLSDFSSETLVAAAEGGMAFAGCRARSTSAGDGNGRRRHGVERRRDGEAVGGWGAAAAVQGGEGQGRGGGRPRRSQRSSTNGRAQKAGEALMLELFLRTSGGGHGGLDLRLECCLDSLLPALNTARGINFLHKTAATADLLAHKTNRTDEMTNRSRTGVARGERGKDRLEGGRNSCGSHSGKRVPPSTARERGKRPIQRPIQRRRFLSKVEVRQRLELPPTPPADRRLSSIAGKDDRSTAPENGKHKTSTLTKDGDNVRGLAGHDATPGVYPHMSDSSSAGGLSASNGKSAAASVLSEGGDGAAALGGIRGDDDTSSFSSLSHGSLSSTSEEDRSEAGGGSNNIDLSAASRKSKADKAEMKKQQAAAGQGLPHDDKTVKQTMTADSNKNSKKVFPILSFGGKKSNDVEEPARNDVNDKKTSSVGNAAAVTGDKEPAGTPAGETKAKKGGGGFVSKLFRRGNNRDYM